MRDWLLEEFQEEDLELFDQEGVGVTQQNPDINMSLASMNQITTIKDDNVGRLCLDYNST